MSKREWLKKENERIRKNTHDYYSSPWNRRECQEENLCAKVMAFVKHGRFVWPIPNLKQIKFVCFLKKWSIKKVENEIRFNKIKVKGGNKKHGKKSRARPRRNTKRRANNSTRRDTYQLGAYQSEGPMAY